MTSCAWVLLVLVSCIERADAAQPPSLEPVGQAASRRTASIHWQRVPLRDAVARLQELFEVTVFIDRRIDPSQRVSLDLEAAHVEDVLTAIAAPRGLGVSRLGGVIYLGPRNASQQLRVLAALRRKDIGRLPAPQRAPLQRKRPIVWPRLTEPRELVLSLVEQRGWRVEQAHRIPHDLWPAGELPGMSLAEQLAVLLNGFDLTFEIGPREGLLVIVPVDRVMLERGAEAAKRQAAGRAPVGPPGAARTLPGTRRVYTLRVAEQPVRAVLQELARRLNWQIDIDEAAIAAAGLSLDKRVSFEVENVEQDELLEALLRPAGLGFRREGERIKIVPRDNER